VEAVQIDCRDVVSFCATLYQFLDHAFDEEQEFGVRAIRAQRCPGSLEP